MSQRSKTNKLIPWVEKRNGHRWWKEDGGGALVEGRFGEAGEIYFNKILIPKMVEDFFEITTNQ